MMTRRNNKRSLNSRNKGEENSEEIPFDLVIEILMKLPVKSIARFSCAAKLWESSLRSPNFTETFFKISSSRPKLLFTCHKGGETFFFTSPQPKNSTTLTASFHMKFPINCCYDICQPIRGLICGKSQRTVNGEIVTVPLICNPSTGETLALPRVRSTRENVISYFGYDPVDKQYKVLCIRTLCEYYCDEDHEYQVLTLGTRKELSWRIIKCDMPHKPLSLLLQNGGYERNMICINGVLYYIAYIYGGDRRFHVVCFDIRSEKFNYIRRADGMQRNFSANLKWTLVNYKGKLATLQQYTDDSEICAGIELWVLEDAEKHEWSSYIYVFPKNMVIERELRFVGMTSTGEIVLSPKSICDSFYLLYYNPEKKDITRVEVQGMEEFRYGKAYTFLDHVENVMHITSVWDR